MGWSNVGGVKGQWFQTFIGPKACRIEHFLVNCIKPELDVPKNRE